MTNDAELIQPWAKNDPKVDTTKAEMAAVAKTKLLRQRLTDAVTAVAISLTCFSLWIYLKRIYRHFSTV